MRPKEQDQWMDVEGLMATIPDKRSQNHLRLGHAQARILITKMESGSVSSVPRLTPWLAGGYHKTEDEMQERPYITSTLKRGGLRYDK
jgi:hypothetical protein